jgi:hypothetical protein
VHTSEPVKLNPASDALRLGRAVGPMIVVGLALAVAGFAVTFGAGLGAAAARRLFFHAYLVAYTFYLSIALGALFFVLLHHLARAGWSVTTRRLAEGLSGNVGLLAVLAVPLLLGMRDLYPWAAGEPLPAAKAAYLNPPAVAMRLAGCFVVWGFLAWFFRSRSVRQDADGDPRLSVIMERVSAPGMIALAVTITLFSIDFLMSLAPRWASTIFGVYVFGDAVLAGLAVLTLLALGLRQSRRLAEVVTAEHYHDLGKLIFTLVFFWGYIAFSQYMLMWYANLPEETAFYLPRQAGPWVGVSLLLLFCHLLIPFLGLISRNAKRRLAVLGFWSVWVLASLVLDYFWLVMPNVSSALEPAGLAVMLGLLLGMGGLFLASTAWLLAAAPLVSVADPRLAESLTFKNQ